MSPPQADKAGLHILLKLAALVIILAGIHAAADILVQLLLALFFAIVLNPLVTWFIRRGVRRPFAITLVVTAMLVMLTALLGVLAASLNDFVAMLPDFNRALTRKILQLQEYLPFLNLHINPERMLRRMDSERLMTWATTLMTQLSGAMASIVLLVMTVIIMCAGIFLPMGPLAGHFKLEALPLSYFPWLVVILLCYAVLTTLLKRVYIKRYGWQ